jgi:cobalamin biosynthesis protein CobT
MSEVTQSFTGLETPMEKIARIMGKKHGVTVVLRGNAAFVNLETMVITLPVSTFGDMPLLKKHLHGLLDHETAHVIYTDSDVFKEIKEMADKRAAMLRKHVWNACEDRWIERDYSKQFRGVAQNLESVNNAIQVKGERDWEEGRVDQLGKIIFALELCWRGVKTPSDFIKDPEVGALLQIMHDVVSDMDNVDTSQKALALADKILDRIQQTAAGEPPPPEAGGDQQSEGEGEPTEGEADSETQAQAQAQAQSFTEQAENDGFQTPINIELYVNAGRTPETDEGDAESKETAAWMDDPKFEHDPNPVKDQQTEFHDWSKSSDPAEYLIYMDTTDEDEVHFDENDRNLLTNEYKKIRNSVHKYIGNLASMLEAALYAQTEARWVAGARRGKKLDRRSVARFAAGCKEDRLFRQKFQNDSLDTAVTMLWDCSGSMGNSSYEGQKANLARIASCALHEALTRARIPHEVLGFDTGGGYSSKVEAATSLTEYDHGIYSRVNELNNHYVFVPFDSPDGRAIAHMNGRAANRDGEAVLWAAKRLAMRQEKRKILIVGSDGHPQGANFHRTEREYLKKVVRQAIGAGIEVYALGIMDDAVKDFYPEWTVLEDAGDLPRAVMNQLVKSLTAQKGQNGYFAA